jgi:SAM-dependent methyltransferase
MYEASKTRKLLKENEKSLLNGKGIDIGCGEDPVTTDCERFDMADGDANKITDHIKEINSYDYVFSAHCLEHMYIPKETIQDWWKLVKPGGVMIVIVPDEDLYEQGYWPSLFNPDHKATFTIGKQTSWSPTSHNLLELANLLPEGELVNARLQDHLYDRKFISHKNWSAKAALKFSAFRFNYYTQNKWYKSFCEKILHLLRVPIDQTLGPASAQNLLIVRKTK